MPGKLKRNPLEGRYNRKTSDGEEPAPAGEQPSSLGLHVCALDAV